MVEGLTMIESDLIWGAIIVGAAAGAFAAAVLLALRWFKFQSIVRQREAKMDTLPSTLLVIIILAGLVWGGGWLLLRRWSWGRWI
jgi:H+/Cl- antiporter ClcA